MQKGQIDRIAMTPAGKQTITFMLKRATEDIEFRERLLHDPESALKDLDLTYDEKTLLMNMRRIALEEAGFDIRPFRAFLRDNGAPVYARKKE